MQKANRSLREMDSDSSPLLFATTNLFIKKQQQHYPQSQQQQQPQQQRKLSAAAATIEEEEGDDDFAGIPKGVLSNQSPEFFRSIQLEIDKEDLEQRCKRYNFAMTKNNSTTTTTVKPQQQRRIFFGSLLADEPLELLQIIAAETHNIFEGMVLVESNRTQSAKPRKFRWQQNHVKPIAKLFGIGVHQLQMRRYINEDTTLDPMVREHRQRQEILKGWKDLGMTTQDVGIIADIDETFTRDFLRAIQTCPYIAALDYNTHHCYNRHVKIAGYTRMFEASPECISKGRTWFHPDMMIGACIELIGNETLNPYAPRVGDFFRAPGYANGCATRTPQMYNNSYGNITKNHYPLWSAADFRRQCGGRNYKLIQNDHHASSEYTAFHFHNFVAGDGDFMSIRQKYFSYGHPVRGAFRKRLEFIGDDLKMAVRCVKNLTDAPPFRSSIATNYMTETQQWQREMGGLDVALPPLPIYFMDKDYRVRKHKAIHQGVLKDEKQRAKRMRLKPHEIKVEALKMEAQELKRQAWQKEEEVHRIETLSNRLGASVSKKK